MSLQVRFCNLGIEWTTVLHISIIMFTLESMFRGTLFEFIQGGQISIADGDR